MPDPHYIKAPITEAVLDIRADVAPDVSLATLEQVQKGEEGSYPFKDTVTVNFGQVQFGPIAGASAQGHVTGYLFRDTHGRHVHQARMDGFTVSRLAPYDTWRAFRTEARRLWEIYRSVTRPVKVSRVALRYLNRIDIPLPVTDFAEYLRTYPELSADLPQGVVGYFMQMSVPFVDVGAMALINEGIVEPARPGVVSVVLDIDVFRTTDASFDEDTIWSTFEQLRNVKNKVFEASVTDTARGLFQ